MSKGTKKREAFEKNPILFLELVGLNSADTKCFWNDFAKLEEKWTFFCSLFPSDYKIVFNLTLNEKFVKHLEATDDQVRLKKPFYSYPCGGGVYRSVDKDTFDSLNNEEYDDV
jgi:hypothetical protein